MRSSRQITVVGCHAAGEIGDVIVGGVLPPPGDSVFAMMRAFERDCDHIRRFLICEPRGSVARHVNLIVPPKRPDCVAGAIIMEPTEYPPMSGSNTMCVATVLLETGMAPMQKPETKLRLDMPGGPVEVTARCEGGRVRSVTIRNVPCFAERLGASLEVEGVGTISVDVAYGGMFYALLDATGARLRNSARRSARSGGAWAKKCGARRAFNSTWSIPKIPTSAACPSSSSTRLSRVRGPSRRNTCIVAPGRSDRSPTGTGLLGAPRGSSRARALAGRGQLLPPLDHRVAVRWTNCGRDRVRRSPGDHSGDHGPRLRHRHHDLLPRSGGIRFPMATSSPTLGASRR